MKPKSIITIVVLIPTLLVLSYMWPFSKKSNIALQWTDTDKSIFFEVIDRLSKLENLQKESIEKILNTTLIEQKSDASGQKKYSGHPRQYFSDLAFSKKGIQIDLVLKLDAGARITTDDVRKKYGNPTGHSFNLVGLEYELLPGFFDMAGIIFVYDAPKAGSKDSDNYIKEIRIAFMTYVR